MSASCLRSTTFVRGSYPMYGKSKGVSSFFDYVCPSQDQRLAQTLIKKHGDDVLDKSFAICSGLDMVNIQLCNVIAPDKDTAEVRRGNLFPRLRVRRFLAETFRY